MEKKRGATKRTSALIAKVKSDILESRKSSKHSVRKLAQERKVGRTTISAILKTDLEMKSKRPFKTFKMNNAHKAKRLKWALKMTQRIFLRF